MYMKKYPNLDVDAYVAKGIELFKQGYNCSQSVVGAYADLYDMPLDLAMRVSSGFGAGFGRLRLTCGAVCGMVILAGLESDQPDPKNLALTGHNYSIVQQLIEKFEDINGSITCSVLLGMKTQLLKNPMPSERNERYYTTRPCARMVASGCEIFGAYLASLEVE